MQDQINALSERARRIIEKSWTPGEWPPDRNTIMLLMQLVMDVGRLTLPDWKPAGTNEDVCKNCPHPCGWPHY